MKRLLVLAVAVGLVACGGAEELEPGAPVSEGAVTLLQGPAPEGEPVLASRPLGDGEVTAQACWVTLVYCSDPQTRMPSCRLTLDEVGCSWQKISEACASLVRDNC